MTVLHALLGVATAAVVLAVQPQEKLREEPPRGFHVARLAHLLKKNVARGQTKTDEAFMAALGL